MQGLKELFTRRDLENCVGSLLIEGTSNRVNLHQLGVNAYIICRAKSLAPVFIANKKEPQLPNRWAKIYFDNFRTIQLNEISIFEKLKVFFIAILLWLKAIRTKKLINMRMGEFFIGDTVYDEYLAQNARGNLRYFDLFLIKTIYLVCREIEINLKCFNFVRPAAVLVTHRVGLSGGIISTIAESRGIPIYSCIGLRTSTLVKSNYRNLFEYGPLDGELNDLISLSKNELDVLFHNVERELYESGFGPDSALAYKKSILKDRMYFSELLGMDINKKNIFVMAHCFLDYPHSRYKGMLFNDHLDWFKKTIEFAAKNKDVNWIFKQHPATKFYKIKDFNWDNTKKEFSSDNMFFMPAEFDFDTRSIAFLGDAVVTCSGSAGFELPAIGGIPSITAGDSLYVDRGFGFNPKSQLEYFDCLKSLKNIKPLTDEELHIARAVFVFTYKMSRVRQLITPHLSFDELRGFQFDDNYFEFVYEIITDKKDLIRADLEKYINIVAQPDFQALRSSLDEICESYGVSYAR